MLKKLARAQILSAHTAADAAARDGGLARTAHRADFSHHPVRPGYLYVRSRAISSRCNDNFDEFPAQELEKSWRTFVGKPVFVNHVNGDTDRARGVCIDAALHRDTNPDGTPDTWVEVLMEVDGVNFPKLAEAILAKRVYETSMGCDVDYSICSACGNKATRPEEYCRHIPGSKGTLYATTDHKTGTRQTSPIREICFGLRFFENSLLVEPPADPTAQLLGIDATGLGKISANRRVCTDCGKRSAMRDEDVCKYCDAKQYAHWYGQQYLEGQNLHRMDWHPHLPGNIKPNTHNGEPSVHNGKDSLVWNGVCRDCGAETSVGLGGSSSSNPGAPVARDVVCEANDPAVAASRQDFVRKNHKTMIDARNDQISRGIGDAVTEYGHATEDALRRDIHDGTGLDTKPYTPPQRGTQHLNFATGYGEHTAATTARYTDTGPQCSRCHHEAGTGPGCPKCDATRELKNLRDDCDFGGDGHDMTWQYRDTGPTLHGACRNCERTSELGASGMRGDRTDLPPAHTAPCPATPDRRPDMTGMFSHTTDYLPDRPGLPPHLNTRTAGYDPSGEWDGEDDDEEREEHAKNWDDIHEYLGGIHRGIGVHLRPEDHAIVHDSHRSTAERAAHLLKTMPRPFNSGENSVGWHWTGNEGVAEDFAHRSYDRAEEKAGRPATAVVFHAHKPDRDDIDETPDHSAGEVYGYHDHGEQEVPLHQGASVRLRGISWKNMDASPEAAQRAGYDPDDFFEPQSEDFTHHEFGGHGHHVEAHNLHARTSSARTLNRMGASTDGYTYCDKGHCHWGTDSAAGMLIHHDGHVLLGRRAHWVQHGGTWGIPGGALHEGEDLEDGAHREAIEELGDLPDLNHTHTHHDDHGGWKYSTVIAAADRPFHPRGGDGETDEFRWVHPRDFGQYDLHPGFAASWPHLAPHVRGDRRTAAKTSAYDELSFEHEDTDTGGLKWPTRRIVHAIHPEHGPVGTLSYYPPKRRGAPLAIDRVETDPKHRGEGVASALMDHIQRTHPASHIEHGDRTPAGKAWWIAYSDGAPAAYRRRGRTMAALRVEAMPPRHTNPADHPFFQEHPVSSAHVVAHWADATPEEKNQGQRWYSDAHLLAHALAHTYANGDTGKAAGVISAYSPRTNWAANMHNAARSLASGRALDVGEGLSIMGVHHSLAHKIMNGEDYDKVLKGPKTNAFAKLIHHGGIDPVTGTPMPHVVIDRHALSVAAGQRLSEEDSKGFPSSTPHYYNHVAKTYQDAADAISKAEGRPVAPHQVQATTWLVRIRHNQAEDRELRGGGGKGRVKNQENQLGQWRDLHPNLLPGGAGTDNMHMSSLSNTGAMKRGDRAAGSQNCSECGRRLTRDWDRGGQPMSCEECHLPGHHRECCPGNSPDTTKALQRQFAGASGRITTHPAYGTVYRADHPSGWHATYPYGATHLTIGHAASDEHHDDAVRHGEIDHTGDREPRDFTGPSIDADLHHWVLLHHHTQAILHPEIRPYMHRHGLPEPSEQAAMDAHLMHGMDFTSGRRRARRRVEGMDGIRQVTPEWARQQGVSPEDEWHGPYQVVQAGDRFHVLDNADRHATVLGAVHGWPTAEKAHGARDYIDQRRAGKERAKGLAEKIFGGANDILGDGADEDTRRLRSQNDQAMALRARFPEHDSDGRHGFDDTGAPFYEVQHPQGWHARYHGGQSFDIHHPAVTEHAVGMQGLSGIDPHSYGTPEGLDSHQLRRQLHEWVDENGADHARQYPQIQQWNRRRGRQASQNPRSGADQTGTSRRVQAMADGSYRMMHQAPDEKSGEPLHEVLQEHPDELHTVYRAVPRHIHEINKGDWVTSHAEYAHQHALELEPGRRHGHVLQAQVPLRHLYTDHNDQNEIGYTGPDLHNVDTHEHPDFPETMHSDEDEEKTEEPPHYAGGAVHLSPQDHHFVHDPNRPAAERAHRLMHALPNKYDAPYSSMGHSTGYWDEDPDGAQFDAEDRADKLGDTGSHPATQFVLHSPMGEEVTTGVSWAQHAPDTYFDDFTHHTWPASDIDADSGLRKRAYGETKAPPQVDTLRDDQCMVCGNQEGWDGINCPVCQFTKPPDLFMDPDTSVARAMDLRGVGDDAAQTALQQGADEIPGGVDQADGQMPGGDPAQGQLPGGVAEGPGGEMEDPQDATADGEVRTLGDGDPAAQEAEGQTDAQAPGGEMSPAQMPPNAQDVLTCPACGFQTPAGPPVSTVTDDPSAPASAGPVAGDVCPNCGKAVLVSSAEEAGLTPPPEVPALDPQALDAQAVPGQDGAPPQEEPAPEEEEAEGDGGEEQEVPKAQSKPKSPAVKRVSRRDKGGTTRT